MHYGLFYCINAESMHFMTSSAFEGSVKKNRCLFMSQFIQWLIIEAPQLAGLSKASFRQAGDNPLKYLENERTEG